MPGLISIFGRMDGPNINNFDPGWWVVLMMYSPKISDDLIPKIYRLGKAEKKPMTRVVDEILRSYLDGIEIREEKIVVKGSVLETRYQVEMKR